MGSLPILLSVFTFSFQPLESCVLSWQYPFSTDALGLDKTLAFGPQYSEI